MVMYIFKKSVIYDTFISTRRRIVRRNFKKSICTAMIITMAAATLATGCKDKNTTDANATVAVTSATEAETTVGTPAATEADSGSETTTAEETQPVPETSLAEGESPEAPYEENGTMISTEAVATRPVTEYPTRANANSLVPTGKTVRSFFTGESMSDKIAYRRPLAVMLNNIQGGLPQRGISKADVIVEGQCEGGITRLMGIFQNYDEIDSIGSIRSCRDYFPFMAAEFDAGYFHFGQSDFALEFLPDPNLMAFSGMNGKYAYVRRADRVSPHNVFTTPTDLVNCLVNNGISTFLDEGFVSPFKFNEGDGRLKKADGYDCKRINIGYAYNNAYFVYNESDHKYYRYEYGNPQIDEMTGQQIAVDNIIIKLVPGQQYWNGSPLYILTGTGEGMYISEGKASWLTWDKEAQYCNTNLGCNYYYGYDPTHYKYVTGEELILNRGTTWICIVETQNKGNIGVVAN